MLGRCIHVLENDEVEDKLEQDEDEEDEDGDYVYVLEDNEEQSQQEIQQQKLQKSLKALPIVLKQISGKEFLKILLQV
ncbi:hypothetical protein R1flu_026681 [Riccia fluitans]|uniref:Uncharacterized protein n=1 Tax=Riccia fluitans TaxID=41844 RepID=A0ABD1XGL8_9MARC